MSDQLRSGINCNFRMAVSVDLKIVATHIVTFSKH
jgi:hypothetical protein